MMNINKCSELTLVNVIWAPAMIYLITFSWCLSFLIAANIWRTRTNFIFSFWLMTEISISIRWLIITIRCGGYKSHGKSKMNIDICPKIKQLTILLCGFQIKTKTKKKKMFRFCVLSFLFILSVYVHSSAACVSLCKLH